MPMDDQPLRTIKCDNDECNKTITFDRRKEKETFESPANTWMKSIRLIQTIDGRGLVYCSDVCEIMGTKAGKHNLPEPKKIIEAASPAAIQAAVAAADAAAKSDENLKSGQGGPVVLA